MRSWVKALICGLGLSLSGFSCATQPPVPECILSFSHKEMVDAILECKLGDRSCLDAAVTRYIVSDCYNAKTKQYSERHDDELDASYCYSPEDREALIMWAKASCKRR